MGQPYMVPAKRAQHRSKTRGGIRLDAPCQQEGPKVPDHTFVPWDANPRYSRCFCGLIRGPRGGLYLLPSPVAKITATPATLWSAEQLPTLGNRTRKRSKAG